MPICIVTDQIHVLLDEVIFHQMLGFDLIWIASSDVAIQSDRKIKSVSHFYLKFTGKSG